MPRVITPRHRDLQTFQQFSPSKNNRRYALHSPCIPHSHHHTHVRRSRRSWSSAPDFRGYVGWSFAPPSTSHLRISSEGISAGALLPRIPHTLPEIPGAQLPILGGTSAGALLPRCRYSEVSWLRSHLSHPSNGLAVERGRNGLTSILDRSRPATILKSPGQARQTIRAYHLVVHRPREGHACH